jgi:hypothetical protein
MAQKDTRIKSYSELDGELESIVAQLNAEPGLAIAALANPVLALEELGYQLDGEVRQEVEDRLRFTPGQAKRIRQLRRQLFEHAGRPFDPASEEELDSVLHEELGLERRELKALAGEHGVVEPLIEYRELDESEPRFAQPEVYRSIRAGKRNLPVSGVRAVLRDRSGR